MMTSILNYLANYSFLSFLCYSFSKLIPKSNGTRKFKNILCAIYSINRRHSVTLNLPVRVRIAPISTCNYRCLFCEIHKDILLYPNRSNNVFNMDDLRRYEPILSAAYSLSFYGGSEEPLLNKYFGEFVAYLKRKYTPRMMVNTNASVLTENLSDILVENGFDHILVSYHAGTKDGYKYLMTGDVEKVDRNLAYLFNQKKLKRKTKPKVDFNFALQKLNADEYLEVINKAKKLGINRIILTRYYGGRNKLRDKQVSFEYDVEQGNRILDEIYQTAKQSRVNLSPRKSNYWKTLPDSVQWDEENYDKHKLCFEPWLSLHFNPVLNDKDCHYVGVCNRIELFKINYRIANLSKDMFNKLWNHPILQYIRETVNSENINPICKFCKNRSLATLRNIDEKRYAQIRDNTVEKLFHEFHTRYNSEPIEGIEILKGHHCPDERYIELTSNSHSNNPYSRSNT